MIMMGACWGSFSAVAGSRWATDSSVRERSRCDSCDRAVKGLEVIPLLSWPLLKGKCRGCGARIPAWCWFIEIATAVGMAAAVQNASSWQVAVANSVFLIVMAVAASADFQARIIPYRVTAAGALLAAAAYIWQSSAGIEVYSVWFWALGGLFLFGGFAAFGWFGLGDALLIGMMGLWLGPLLTVAVVVAIIAGALEHVADRLITKQPMKDRQKPFVPALFVGAIVAVSVGWPAIDLYVSMGQ